MESLQIWKLQKPIFANAILEKELGMLSRLLKTFGMKHVKAVVDAFPHDGKMTKNQTLFGVNLAER